MNTAVRQQHPEMTGEELSRASEYLAATRDDLAEAFHGLSAAQWTYKPAPDRWSIAEVVEHLVMAEGRVHSRFAHWPEGAAESNPERTPSEMDARILAEVPVRTPRIQAPAFFVPTGQWSTAEALERFLSGRSETLRLLVATPALRAHSMPHPVFGPWDGYQWLLAVAAHCARHIDQIREVKACSGFPAASISSR